MENSLGIYIELLILYIVFTNLNIGKKIM